MRILFGRVVHGEEDAECGRWWLFIYLFIIIIIIYIIFLIRVANLHTYMISNMRYFNTIITGKKVQKKN